MKKILGLIGSPRNLGNCEIMIKEICRNIGAEHKLSLLRLNDFNILPCRGCYRCLFKKESCVLDDDLSKIIDAITSADALIVAAPTYFLGANACLKRLLDRGLSFYAHIDMLWGKPAVGIGIAGIEGKEGYTLLCIENFIKMIFAKNMTSKICYGALPGETVLNEQNRNLAGKMASLLFEPSAAYQNKQKDHCCPLCGGETFRFLGGNQVLCMLCSNPGTIDMASGVPIFNIIKSKHQLCLSKQDALAHKQWLLQMKNRYLRQKDKLKTVSLTYLKEGEWIKP